MSGHLKITALTLQPLEVHRHVALDALAVVLCGLAPHQRGVVLGQPISHFALRGHHGGLQRAQVPPAHSGSAHSALLGARSVVVRRELGHVVLDGDFSRGSVVELDGEGGVALSCGRHTRTRCSLAPSHSFTSVLKWSRGFSKPALIVVRSALYCYYRFFY